MNIKVIIPQHYSIARSFYDASFIEEIIEGLPENLRWSMQTRSLWKKA